MTETYIHQAVGRALNGLKMALGRGRITLTDETGTPGVQMVQVRVSAKEVMDMPRLAEFGLASWIPKDGDVAVVFINAERTNGIAVASGHQTYRFKLENEGEVAIYDAFGKSVWFKKDTGGIVIEANNQPVALNNAKGVTLTNVTGDVVLNMGGKNVTIVNPGSVVLSDQNGEKSVVRDGDPVSGGVVHATQTAVKA